MKTVLITGGTVRLGKAMSDRLKADGWRVIASSHRADSCADIVADLAEPMGPARLYSETMRLLDGRPPDALVNNAALYAASDAIMEAVNLTAPKKLIMMMAGRESGCGSVVNILDSVILAAASDNEEHSRFGGVYTRTKRELLEYTRTSAVMFAETLRVNAVAPGSVLAPIDVREKASERLLAHRPTPEDVAEAVAFLLRAEATTGLVIPVDGGRFY